MKIALLGTGLMGRPMAERVLQANHELVVFNRSAEKAEPLRALGAEISDNVTEAIRSSVCIILMLSDAQAIQDVLLTAESRTELPARTVIQMGTISPAESISLQRDVRDAGGEYMEAPVLGSVPQAEAGKLIVMVGAASEQFERWSEVLKCFCVEPLLIGPVGRAAALKLAMNQLIASHAAAFSLSLGFVQRNGISVELFMKILSESALYAPVFHKKLQPMMKRDFSNPNFPTKHMVKDVDLFLSEAKALNLETAALEGIRHLLTMTLDRGLGEADYSSLFDTINPKT